MEQAWEHGTEVKTAIKTILGFGQVTVRIFLKLATVMNRQYATIQCTYELDVVIFQDLEISLIRTAV